MANKHGDFIWYEMLTSDADAAEGFYKAVVGWSVGNFGPGMDYRILSTPTGQVGGLMELTPEMSANGARPCWMGYIGVDDVDACAERIKAAGGGVHVPPTDIPGVGRFAFVNDPQGVMFYIMRGASDEDSNAFAATEPMLGHCAWNELSTTDPEAAKAFYGSEFGWAQDGDIDMGPLGKYEFWWDNQRRFMLGAVMPKIAEDPSPHWLYYFRVADIDDAVARIGQHGGQLREEPMQIPGGTDWSLQAMDPEGAWLGLVGPKK